MFLYHSLCYIFETVRESRFRNSAGLQWWRGRKAMRRSVQWEEDMLSLPGTAQGCWRRKIWDKTRCLEGWGPIQRGKGKKGRVTPGEGGGGGKLRIHRFALNQTKSKFLGVHVAMQLGKWAGNLRGRDSEDTHGHLHFKRKVFHHIRTRWPSLMPLCGMKGDDVSARKLALLWQTAGLGVSLSDWRASKGLLSFLTCSDKSKPISTFP